MGYYRRDLPHWQPQGRLLFVTCRLYGSMPYGWRPGGSGGHAFVEYDRMLESATAGPTWMARAEIAEVVANSIVYGVARLGRYDLFAWVVMPNHVHVLIDAAGNLGAIMKTLKGYTAREANRILRRRGQFWQHESFDHWVRDEHEFRCIANYIENNPVKAGLAARPEDYRWSSAFGGISRQACASDGAR
ncbi:MAG TPA: transposase [Bryobacteraceae bacterium]|nr:transposase [Bryobacteraceae bacterium]